MIRFVSDKFVEDTRETYFDQEVKTISVDNRSIQVKVIDPAGQEKYSSLRRNYYSEGDGVFLMFDLTSEESFRNAKHKWETEVEKFCGNDVVKVLVGTKKDLNNNREVNNGDARDYANQQSLSYYEISSKTNDNVNEAFNEMVKSILAL
uniref:Uncharacterized protein n=1 Tax=Arcella intermedia TaxID=1963864 RepID=A0A6B2LNK5_9EUKA